MIRSVLVGSLYAVIALGMTQIYSVTKIANFAHGDFATIGAYTSVLMTVLGVSFVASLPMAFGAAALFGILTNKMVLDPLTKRRSTGTSLLVATFGVSFVIRYVLYFVVATVGWVVVRPRFPIEVLFTFDQTVITNLFILAVPLCLCLVVLFQLFLSKTLVGKAMRGIAANKQLAQASGVPVNSVVYLTWLLSAGLAGIGGGLWAAYSMANPVLGWTLILRVFAASTLGGFTSFYGTVAGAYIVGIAENLGIETAAQYLGISTAYKPLVSFIIVGAVLLLRPAGLAGISLRGLRRCHGLELRRKIGRLSWNQS